MSADLRLVSTLVDELEATGVRFDFYQWDDGDIGCDWCTTGTANAQRAGNIIRLGLAETDFGIAFRQEVARRWDAGRMVMLERKEARP